MWNARSTHILSYPDVCPRLEVVWLMVNLVLLYRSCLASQQITTSWWWGTQPNDWKVSPTPSRCWMESHALGILHTVYNCAGFIWYWLVSSLTLPNFARFGNNSRKTVNTKNQRTQNPPYTHFTSHVHRACSSFQIKSWPGQFTNTTAIRRSCAPQGAARTKLTIAFLVVVVVVVAETACLVIVLVFGAVVIVHRIDAVIVVETALATDATAPRCACSCSTSSSTSSSSFSSALHFVAIVVHAARWFCRWCSCAIVRNGIGVVALGRWCFCGATLAAVWSVEPADGHPLRRGVHLLDGQLERRNRIVDVIVDDGQIEEMAVRLAQCVRFFRESLQTSVRLCAGHTEWIRMKRNDREKRVDVCALMSLRFERWIIAMTPVWFYVLL